MARLDDLLPEFKKIESCKDIIEENKQPTGLKRRAWLVKEDEQKKEKTVKPYYRTLPLPPKENDPIKGVIKPVHRPLLLCFYDLRSNPLQLFRFLYELTKNEKNNYKTSRVRLSEIMKFLHISKDSTRTALRFLLKQGFINRIEFQPGKLGWSRYELNKKACKELEHAILNGRVNHFSVSTYRIDQADSASETKYSDAWDEIDISPLETIGFSKKHLLQIKNKTNVEVVQESINHFAYALKFNRKIQEYTNPLATLIAVLKRGESWIEPNYRSPQELSQLQLLEIKKAELERMKVLEEKLYKVAFEEWRQKLSKEETEVIAPDLRKRGDLTPPLAKLGIYFRERIWTTMKKDYLV